MRFKLFSFCALVALLVTLAPPAQGAVTFNIEVGRFFDESDHTAESMRFYPSDLRVVPGDTLHFSTESFHGVTLLPAGNDAATWAQTHTTDAGAWSVFDRDPDEGADAARANLTVMTPSRPCGWPGQPACEFDGTGDPVLGPLNSGLAIFPTDSGSETRELSFDVVITADPGTTIHVLDPLHPAMTMAIDVVATFAERTHAAAATSASDQLFAADKERARRLHSTYSKRRVKRIVQGKTVWHAWAGVEEGEISLRRMYPKQLTIKPGQRVRWNFGKNVFEAHSVTFPRSNAVGLARAFPDIVCDTNGDDDPAPDSQTSSTNFPFCSSFGELELDVPQAMVISTGNGAVTTARDKETSGARGAAYAPHARAYELGFPTRSAQSGFTYACAIHEAAHAPMRATVVVKP